MVELVPLATMTAVLRRPHVVGGAFGARRIFEVESGTIEGERLRATLKGSANGDWLRMGADGVAELDVRALVETHDGALVFMQYTGRTDTTAPGAPLYATPRFETGDERYRWLNRVQAVAKGTFDGHTLVYELYELR